MHNCLHDHHGIIMVDTNVALESKGSTTGWRMLPQNHVPDSKLQCPQSFGKQCQPRQKHNRRDRSSDLHCGIVAPKRLDNLQRTRFSE